MENVLPVSGWEEEQGKQGCDGPGELGHAVSIHPVSISHLRNQGTYPGDSSSLTHEFKYLYLYVHMPQMKPRSVMRSQQDGEVRGGNWNKPWKLVMQQMEMRMGPWAVLGADYQERPRGGKRKILLIVPEIGPRRECPVFLRRSHLENSLHSRKGLEKREALGSFLAGKDTSRVVKLIESIKLLERVLRHRKLGDRLGGKLRGDGACKTAWPWEWKERGGSKGLWRGNSVRLNNWLHQRVAFKPECLSQVVFKWEQPNSESGFRNVAFGMLGDGNRQTGGHLDLVLRKVVGASILEASPWKLWSEGNWKGKALNEKVHGPKAGEHEGATKEKS